MTDERGEELQNAVIHEGAPPDGRDSNEDADDKVTIVELEDADSPD